jgi:hypothetical protein
MSVSQNDDLHETILLVACSVSPAAPVAALLRHAREPTSSRAVEPRW